jgi:hypothetical protein
VDFLFYFILSKPISHRSITMEGRNSPPHKKSRKQIQQVIKLKFLMLYNDIELTYDCKKGGGIKLKVMVTTNFINYILRHVEKFGLSIF